MLVTQGQTWGIHCLLAHILKEVQINSVRQIGFLAPRGAHPEAMETDVVCQWKISFSSWTFPWPLCPLVEGMSAAVPGSEIAVCCESQLFLILLWPEEGPWSELHQCPEWTLVSFLCINKHWSWYHGIFMVLSVFFNLLFLSRKLGT